MGKGRPGPRPEMWISGPDQVRHQQHVAWRQQKNQAQWRGETWDLAFDHWIELWGDLWPRRGRLVDDYCMTRKDWELPWTRDNTHVITRAEHACMHGHHASTGYVSPARIRWRERTGQVRKFTRKQPPCNE
jgi:hypothetical protein